jgi:hypothetical protein
MSTKAATPPISVLVNGRKESGEVKFDHKWKDASGSWKSGDIVIEAGTPEHEIIFEVDPASSKKLRFVDDPNDAIWVGTSQCPKQASNEGDQITPIAVEADGSRLRVANANKGEPSELHFALRFKRRIPILLKPHKYDPVIKNGGGGG